MKLSAAIMGATAALLAPGVAEALCVYPTGSPPEQVCADVIPTTDPIVIELGQSIPLPIHYRNYTERDMTFETALQGNILFPGNHTLNTATLAPHTEASFTDVVLQTDGSMPIGADHIVIGWGATGGDYRVSAQATIEVDLVVPRLLQDVIQLPTRWCVVEGSPQAQGHHAGDLISGSNVFQILQHASDDVWMPQAQIFFRNVIADGIPVICDPNPPPAGRGVLGDLQESGGGQILSLATIACRKAWERIAPNQPGHVVVSAGSFHDFGIALGVTSGPGSSFQSPRICAHPRSLGPLDVQFMESTVLVDYNLFNGVTYPSGVRPPLVLAHELGHQLLLGHGNGLDDNGDGLFPPADGARLYDEYCDPLCAGAANCETVPIEDELTPFTTCEASSSLMYYSVNPDCSTLRPLQIEAAREAAIVSPGAIINGVTNPGDGRLPDYYHDSCSPATALVLIQGGGLTETRTRDTTRIYYEVPGTYSSGSALEYLAFADLDNSPTTGCAPALLGFTTGFQGAELVTRVTITQSASGPLASTSVWQCAGSVFEVLSDWRIQTTVSEATTPGVSGSTGHIVVVSVPSDRLGSASDVVRLQLEARDSSQSPRIERIPASDAGSEISRIPPILPQCTLSRILVNPGGVTRASASGLLPNAPVEAFVGGEPVAQAIADGTGSVQVDIHVPAASRQGVRPVLLASAGSARTAACSVLIGGNAVTPATTATLSPEPNSSGWNNADVTVALNAVDVPGGPGIAEIVFSATGAQPIASTLVPAASASVAISSEGLTAITYYATNNNGVSENAETMTVRLDRTAPVVTYTGNAGSYAVDATVSIQCTATDALSGIVASSCPNIAGPAYLFGAGTHTYSATARDFAGNAASASTMFDIEVTYAGLCTLTRRLVEDTGFATALCYQLDAASAADRRGNERAKGRMLAAYRYTLQSEGGRTVSREDARILADLSRGL